VQPEGLDKLKNFNDLIGTRTHDLPASSIECQQFTLARAASPHGVASLNNPGMLDGMTSQNRMTVILLAVKAMLVSHMFGIGTRYLWTKNQTPNYFVSWDKRIYIVVRGEGCVHPWRCGAIQQKLVSLPPEQVTISAAGNSSVCNTPPPQPSNGWAFVDSSSETPVVLPSNDKD
jgi:hypothetical protein